MLKKYRRGFILGKFMPFHRGHQFLIETALEQVDELTVLMCSLPSEPIPGWRRYQWVKETFPQVRVLHVTDLNPSVPGEHRFFWEIWENTIRRNVPGPVDAFFSSETYGFELARRLGIEHVLVDQARQRFPVSGTSIRINPLAQWQYLPAAVRPFYLKRIALVGPESTGKSTLSRQLAGHFQTNCVEEYGRTYCELFGNDCDALDLVHIATGQLFLEDEAAKTAKNGLLICDTDALVTQTYAELYLGHCPDVIVQLAESRRYDRYLLLDTDMPWVNDGTRLFADRRQWHFDRLKELLESQNRPYAVISGNLEERFERAIEAVKTIL